MDVALVDVLIPVFNAAETVRQAIESIQQQTARDIRILVVDDGSTDATPTILADLARTDPRVSVITKPNSGIVDALNLGLGQCHAEFIARHDGDDIANADRLAEQIGYLRSHPDCVAVSNAVRHIDEDGNPTGYIASFLPPDRADPSDIPSHEPYLLHPFLTARRSSIQSVGGYRHVFYAEDTDLYWRLQEIGTLHNMDVVLGDYRVHVQSVSSSSIGNGRIGALNSQLAAISARRRRSGRHDLAFPAEAIRRYQAAETVSRMYDLGCLELDFEERSYLEVAFAAKLMDLASYKPYELELDDCRFIREAVSRQKARLTREHRRRMSRSISGTAARLASNGRFAEATALLSPELYPLAAARLAFRLGLPLRVRNALGKLLYREAFQK